MFYGEWTLSFSSSGKEEKSILQRIKLWSFFSHGAGPHQQSDFPLML